MQQRGQKLQNKMDGRSPEALYCYPVFFSSVCRGCAAPADDLHLPEQSTHSHSLLPPCSGNAFLFPCRYARHKPLWITEWSSGGTGFENISGVPTRSMHDDYQMAAWVLAAVLNATDTPGTFLFRFWC